MSIKGLRNRQETAKEEIKGSGSRRRKDPIFPKCWKARWIESGALLRVVCDAADIKSTSIGRIDIMASFSFFDADEDLTNRILKSVDGTSFEGTKLSIEVTNNEKVEAQGDLVEAREDQEAEEVFVHRVVALKEIAQQNEVVQKEDQDLIDQEGIEDVNSIQV